MADDVEKRDTVKMSAVVSESPIEILSRTMHARFDSQDTILRNVVNEGVEANTRLSRLENRVEDVEVRMTRNSDRVRGVTASDSQQNIMIDTGVHERAALREQLEKLAAINSAQLQILSRLDAITKNPLVKTLAAMLATSLITWLATKGIAIP